MKVLVDFCYLQFSVLNYVAVQFLVVVLPTKELI